MKGSNEIPVFLYVIIGLFVLVSMLLIISKYSTVFFIHDKEIKFGNNKLENSKALTIVIQKCWDDHRRGLDSKSDVCKEISFENNVGFAEKDVNKFLDCKILPNSNCDLDDCSDCSSPYFNDTDKIMWFAESENNELRISYFGSSRKIVVVGSPCDEICLCKRDCKQACIEGLSRCEGCLEKCE